MPVLPLSADVHPVAVHPGGAPALGAVVRVDGAATILPTLVDEGEDAGRVRVRAAHRPATSSCHDQKYTNLYFLHSTVQINLYNKTFPTTNGGMQN